MSVPPRIAVLVTVGVEAPVLYDLFGVESAADARRPMAELRDAEATVDAVQAALACALEHDVPAFGIPGWAMVDDELTSPCLEGIGPLYVVQEPDNAGELFVAALLETRLADRITVVSLGAYKDISAVHLAVSGDRVQFVAALETAKLALAPATDDADNPFLTSRPDRDATGTHSAPTADPTATAPEPPFALPLDEFIAQTTEIPPALIGAENEIVLPTYGLGMLFGKGGKGKTTLVVELMLHLASGIGWLGFTVQRPLRVLLIENEGPREPFRAKLAAKRAGWPHPIRGGLFIYTLEWGAFSLDYEEQVERLVAFVAAEGIDLVIGDPLDTLGVKGVGSPENTRDFMALMSKVGLFRSVAFLLPHYPRKQEASEELDEIQGAWGGKPDVMLKLSRMEGNRSRLSFPKLRWSRLGSRPALILAFDPETQSFTLAAEEEPEERDYLAEIVTFLGAASTIPGAEDGTPKWLTATEISAPKEPKDDAKPGIGANRDLVLELLKGHPDLFVSRTGEDAAEVGRSKQALVWQLLARVSEQVEQVPRLPGLDDGTCTLAQPYKSKRAPSESTSEHLDLVGRSQQVERVDTDGGDGP